MLKGAKGQVFHSVLEKEGDALGWTIARVPFDPAKVWVERERLRVKGTINGFAFRSSLFPVTGEKATYFILVNKSMQAGAGVRLGSVAQFALEADLDPRPAELPDELDALLDDVDGLREWYDALTEYTRREIGKWILLVKTGAARVSRAQQTAERLLSTMEAEVELPPSIAAPLRKNPKAQAGWQRMTPLQRRAELMGVFYYQSPEARTKRIGKLIDAALKRGATAAH